MYISKAYHLIDGRADSIAALILEELNDGLRWDESFARSPDLLAKLAAEAMAEHRAGKTEGYDLILDNF